MSKICDDFSYLNKTLKSINCITVDFDDSSEIPLALSREINKGEANSYRKIANHYGTKYSDVLKFQIHICKDPTIYPSQVDMVFTEDEIRTITKWITSSNFPKWLKTSEGAKITRYNGLFTNVETFVVGGEVLGFKLEFTCDGQYAYTDDLSTSSSVTGYTSISITNNSDELESYVYPTVTVNSAITGNVFMFNETDSVILASGILTLDVAEGNSKSAALLNTILAYAESKGYETEFKMDDNNTVVLILDNTGVEFKYVDKFGSKMNCTAYCDYSDNYKIFSGGFMRLKALSNNPITINCEKYQIYDSLDREIMLSDIGLEDIGEMYWMRFLNGDNTIRLFANNATITFIHKEERKVGAV